LRKDLFKSQFSHTPAALQAIAVPVAIHADTTYAAYNKADF
jgi:hypothetical protein